MAAHAPKGLKATGKKLWQETTAKYDLRQDELETLRAVCGEADLISQMEDELEGEALTTLGSMGQMVIHPLVPELRQHRTTLASLLRSLKLPDDDAGAESNQQREAAQSRWAAAHGKAS
jgi:hypothetical protein